MHTVFEQKIKDKGLEFITDIDKGVPSSIVFDEIRIRQVIINLIGNATKFTDFGQIKLCISSSESPASTRSQIDLKIKVSDTGIGIAEGQKKKIFGTFEQVKNKKTDLFGGTGLGLAISKRLVEMMGGQITVESVVDKGSTFTVIIPGIEIASAEAISQKEESYEPALITFEPATILIAMISTTTAKYWQHFWDNGISRYSMRKTAKKQLDKRKHITRT